MFEVFERNIRKEYLRKRIFEKNIRKPSTKLEASQVAFIFGDLARNDIVEASGRPFMMPFHHDGCANGNLQTPRFVLRTAFVGQSEVTGCPVAAKWLHGQLVHCFR